MREICETGDAIEVDGQTFILARVSSRTIDALGNFEAEGEDRENDIEDEPGEDLEPGSWPNDCDRMAAALFDNDAEENGDAENPGHPIGDEDNAIRARSAARLQDQDRTIESVDLRTGLQQVWRARR